ncbi:hypothetical protein [Ideonella livida]|uniref:Uncharacterized protein n=1 Tax=Ideonella livida TaxID=2707176 RepID=A0A7C9TLD1_9BURK|nr:hypothetical protein [Ideonella livida]NDY93098.1 hypothetical protein [Ideonella livida]
MTRRCILHVGLHKTGSSSIQETLYRNASLRGAHYLDLGEANASGMVKLLFGGAEQASQTPLARQQGDEAARDLARKRLDRALAEVGPADTVIFSAEALSRLSIHGLQALQAALAPQFQSIEVVGYVRDMPGFMASAFQQRVKGGHRPFRPAPALSALPRPSGEARPGVRA